MPVYVKDYPRPQFVRQQWQSLNGQWHFAFDDEDKGIREGWQTQLPGEGRIVVPFTYETAMSGIGDPSVHNVVWYQRAVALRPHTGRVLLHFEGSDYTTQVWVNGLYQGCHEGGYSRFSLDVTEAARNQDAMQITVRVWDSLDQDQPRGKQRFKPESWGCWYEQTTGIWKTVWLEYLPEAYLRRVECTPDAAEGVLRLTVETAGAETGDYALEAEISLAGQPITTACFPLPGSYTQLQVPLGENLRLWCPEDPALYDIRYRLTRHGETVDMADSYFGIRTITIDGNRILLNGEPLYLRMILDQGYWKDSGLTPPSEEALIRDIDITLRYGYNGARKHQKIEDERYLYWCDVKGLLVWSEMAATYSFGTRAVERFTDEWTSIVRQHKNHPCIITWVPFNESWGIGGVKDKADQQAFVNGIYHLTKALDPTRPVVTNDGWEHTISDIVTIHDYREYGSELEEAYLEPNRDILMGRRSMSWYGQLLFAQGYGYRGQPVILSEYGGIALRNESGWGYGNQVQNVDEFLARFQSQNIAIGKVSWFTGFCYTQLTDVQQEVNGLVDMERRDKFPPDIVDRIRAINQDTGK